MNMLKKHCDIGYYVSFVISFITLLFLWKGYFSGRGRLFGSNFFYSNVSVYVVGIIVFTVLFCTCFLLSGKLGRRWGFFTKKLLPFKLQIISVSVMVVVGLLIFAHWGLITQFDEVGVENGSYYALPMSLRLIMSIVLFGGIIWFIVKKREVENVIVYSCYFLSLVISFYGIYIANPFLDVTLPLFSGQMIGVTSVTETIYNLLDGVPYTWDSVGLYGHYGLFFLIPLKILGDGPEKIAFLLAMSGCIEQLVYIYVIDSVAPKKWIKIIFALAGIVRTTYIYPAVIPIRTLWPMLLCAYMCGLSKYKKKIGYDRWLLIGYLLCACSILWNTETGLGCLMGFTVYCCLNLFFTDEGVNFKKLLFRGWSLFVYIGMAIILPIIIVNGYNIIFCRYRAIEIGSFFYPYLGSTWTTSDLRCNPPLGNHAWVYIMILLLGCWSWTIIRIYCKSCIEETMLNAGVTVIGLVVFTYYFNEAHWGCMDIVKKICACLILFILNRNYELLEEKCDDFCGQIKRTVVILAIMIFGLLSMETLLTDFYRISSRYVAGAYDSDSLKNNVEEEFIDNIPENTYGVGQGIHIIYHILGWDNHAAYRDSSSLGIADSAGSYDRFIDEVANQDELLIGNSLSYDLSLQKELFSREDTYELKKVITVCGYEYAYYVKK